MKNILLATDFSQNAHVAAICAAELCARMGGRLVIFHALPAGNLQKGNDQLQLASMEEITQKKLDELAQELFQRFGLSVSRLLKPGNAEEEIPNISRLLKADLVVLGARGGENKATERLGATSTHLLQTTDLPVICVPDDTLHDFSSQLSLILNKKQPLCNKLGSDLLTALSCNSSAEYN